jgi:pyruvate carboxylase
VSGDAAHTVRASHSIELPSAAAFMSVDALVGIVKRHQIDAVHPGYGFLSESPGFAKRMWDEVGAVVVGPGWSILENTGDKLKARKLAEQCEIQRAVHCTVLAHKMCRQRSSVTCATRPDK